MRTPKEAPKTFEYNPNLKRNEEIIRETREYELITPLFGGGAVTKKADEISVIRATEIRGHLRFWWRATRGGQFSTIEELREHEDAIFGSTERNSELQVEVFDYRKISEDYPFEVVLGKPNKWGISKPKTQPNSDSVVPPYSAFPLQPKTENLKVGMLTDSVTTQVTFKIIVSFPSEFKIFNQNGEVKKSFIAKDEIPITFWAWETFGGIGARTRRGFGALNLLRVDKKDVQLPASNSIQVRIKTELSKIETKSEFTSSSVPHLSKNIIFCLTRKTDKAEKSWEFLIKKLKNFRQYRKDKETKIESPFGKSQWTEPDALRYRMEKRNYRPQIDKFPRAEFGLPILFHMPQPFDDFDATLKGIGGIERLSSPLILRPIKCSDGYLGIGLILDTPRIPPNGLSLDGVEKENEVLAKLTKIEAEELTETLEVLNNEKDILEAFLKYLEK